MYIPSNQNTNMRRQGQWLRERPTCCQSLQGRYLGSREAYVASEAVPRRRFIFFQMNFFNAYVASEAVASEAVASEAVASEAVPRRRSIFL